VSNTFTFDAPSFRVSFPAFANVTTYPTATLQMNWDGAGCIVENTTYDCYMLEGICRYRALNLLTAHLTALSDLIAAGQVPGLVQNATVDKVTVGLTPPPLQTQFQWWLSLTSYGQQLLVLLQVSSVGGEYYGGLPETSAFRKVGGVL
jgi:hypothetical protein